MTQPVPMPSAQEFVAFEHGEERRGFGPPSPAARECQQRHHEPEGGYDNGYPSLHGEAEKRYLREVYAH